MAILVAILVAVIVPAFDPSLAHPAFPVCTLTATAYKAELQLHHAQLKEQAQVNIVASVARMASMASSPPPPPPLPTPLVSLADGLR